MAASVTGTPVELTSTSQSVTVPANAKAAVFTWSYWNASSGQGLASATLNGVAPDAAVESATGAGGADATATGIALFLAPATGSHTFAHAFDAAQTEGPTRTLTFLTADGAIALRGSLQAANASGAGAASVSLTGLTAGDLALAHDQKFGASPANQSGWTSLATGSNNSEFWRVRSIAAAGTSVTASAQGPNYSSIAAGAFYDAGGTPSPALTDVDTDETVLDGQTGVAITGTDMGANNAARTFTLRQASTSVPQTETGSGTATAATLTIGIEQSGADIKFGAATLRVTRTSDSAFGEIAITVNPPTGQLYVDVGTPDTTAANRITAVADIASGDQLQARGVGGGAVPAGLTIDSAARFQFAVGETPTAFDVRVWDASDSTWGAWATQGIAGGVAESVGRADETDSAQALNRSKAKSTGLSSESDSALAAGRVKTRSAGLAAETDVALALDYAFARGVGISTESDTAFGSARSKSKSAGLASETDAALALAATHARVAGLATEADSATALSARKSRDAGLAAESDTAFALSEADGAIKAPVERANETDTALTLARQKAKAVSVSQETDSAHALHGTHLRGVGLASELATAFACSAIKVRPVGIGSEIDTALQRPVAGILALPVGLAEEFDSAFGPKVAQREQEGAGGFWYWAERHRLERERARRRKREIEDETRDIEEAQAREIARLLRQQEEIDAKRAELDRLQRLADRYAAESLPLTPSAAFALTAAQQKRTENALLHLQREIAQMLEEEEAMVIALLMLDDQPVAGA